MNNGIVTLSLDEGYEVCKDAADYMANYGDKLVVYVRTNAIDTPTYLTSAQILNLHNMGCEISSHTVSHTDCSTATYAEIEAAMADSRTALEAIIGAGNVFGFAYPGGDYGPDALMLSPKYYKYASTDVNGEWLRPYWVCRKTTGTTPYPQYGLSNAPRQTYTSLALAKAGLDTASRENWWINVYFHDLDTGDGDSINLAEWKELYDYAKSLGMKVRTVQEMLSTNPVRDIISADNLVDNPTWNPLATRWRQFNATGCTYAAADGVLTLTAGASAADLRQYGIPVKPGMKINYSVDVRRTAGTGTLCGLYLINNAIVDSSTPTAFSSRATTNADWTTLSNTNVVVPSGCFEIVARLYCATNGTVMDVRNLTVTPVTTTRTAVSR